MPRSLEIGNLKRVPARDPLQNETKPPRCILEGDKKIRIIIALIYIIVRSYFI
jgi:hypothetical protein